MYLQIHYHDKKWHWCTIGVQSFLADFEIIPIPMVEGQIYGGWERGSGGGAPC
jgi:hypothetical protein